MPGPNPIPAQTAQSTRDRDAASSCYNCRRRRLRCDRSRPSCRKCWVAGVECLGYGTVLRWANGPAIRGNLVGQLSSVSGSRSVKTATVIEVCNSDEGFLSINPSLCDPLLNGLNRRARHYLHHFATAVCRDLVSIDQHDQNPFRAILPLAVEFDFLEAIIVATGAMHLATLHGYQDQLVGRRELIDALVAKDKAIRLLRCAVDRMTPANQAMVLAATVFLINLDLIDSGKGSWQVHIDAASKLMSSLHGPAPALDGSLMSLVDAIAADCLTYRVLGSAISGFVVESWAEHDLADLFSVLKRAEPYSYHCCPPGVLQITLSASRLCSGHGGETNAQTRIDIARSLLQQARSLDVLEWVYNIRGLSAHDDLNVRVSLASAHRATACLYIVLAVPEAAEGSVSAAMLVQEVLSHLANVPIDHVLLKGTVWPTFVAGAQTDDLSQREWCIERMHGVWATNPWICPWGYVRTAIEMLHRLWEARDREPAGRRKTNWLQQLKSMRDKCLIV